MAITWTKLIPRWSGDTIEPPEAKKDTGYIAGDKPPAKWENWLRKGTYEALDETRDVIENIDSQLAQDVQNLAEHRNQNVTQTIYITRDVSITGVQLVSTMSGKIPKRIAVTANVPNTKKVSISNTIGNETTVYQIADSGIWATRSSSIAIADTSSNRTFGTIANITNGGFEITWSHTGTGATGTAFISIAILYHD